MGVIEIVEKILDAFLVAIIVQILMYSQAHESIVV